MNMSHNKKQEQDIYQALIFKSKKKKNHNSYRRFNSFKSYIKHYNIATTDHASLGDEGFLSSFIRQ